jgi:hypothetical protein
MKRLTLGLLAGLVLLVGCGAGPADDSVQFRGAAVCTSVVPDPFGNYIRVDDSLCPIGDGDVPGWPYRWNYAVYPHRWYGGYDDIDYVYVGQPIQRTVFVVGRPAGWRALDVDRGLPRDCGCRVQPGQPPPTHATLTRTGVTKLTKADAKRLVPNSPVAGSKTVTRGGLGSARAADAKTAPAPNRSLDSKAPTRDGTVSKPSTAKPSTARPIGSSMPKAAKK